MQSQHLDDDVILNIVKRKTRYSFAYKLPDKKVSSIMNAFGDFRNLFGENFDKIFRTITTDNGNEFSSFAELEKISKILVYFAHPTLRRKKEVWKISMDYLRRFIPKGNSIRDFSAEYISKIVYWANSLPRRLLQYDTAEEYFLSEVNGS